MGDATERHKALIANSLLLYCLGCSTGVFCGLACEEHVSGTVRRHMANYIFERECRTANSEAYTILDGDTPVARIDLHFTPSIVHGTLNVGESVTQEGIQDLIESIDQELVMSADVSCEDFVVVVYQGREVGTFSSQDFEDETEQEEQQGEQKTW